jgi:hypothetical protein
MAWEVEHLDKDRGQNKPWMKYFLPPFPSSRSEKRKHLDEDGGKALGAQLLVDAEEVDLHHGHSRGAHAHAGGHPADEGHQLAVAAHAHAQVPVLAVARREQRPFQKLPRVVEPARPPNVRYSPCGVLCLDRPKAEGQFRIYFSFDLKYQCHWLAHMAPHGWSRPHAQIKKKRYGCLSQRYRDNTISTSQQYAWLPTWVERIMHEWSLSDRPRQWSGPLGD